MSLFVVLPCWRVWEGQSARNLYLESFDHAITKPHLLSFSVSFEHNICRIATNCSRREFSYLLTFGHGLSLWSVLDYRIDSRCQSTFMAVVCLARKYGRLLDCNRCQTFDIDPSVLLYSPPLFWIVTAGPQQKLFMSKIMNNFNSTTWIYVCYSRIRWLRPAL